MREPDPIPSTVGADRFKAAFRRHAAGVAIVSATVDGQPHALTASSVTSVSADPAVLLFSVATGTRTGQAIANASHAVVHLLDVGDRGLAERCANPEADRFADAATWEWLPTGEPAFLAPRVLLRGEVCDRLVFGGAIVLVLAVTDIIERRAETARPAAPLAYVDRTWHGLSAVSEVR